MKCWACNTNLIWTGDRTIEGDGEDFTVASCFSCPECTAYVEFYTPRASAARVLSDMMRKGETLN